MALKGDLTSVGLADVFQMLALNRKEGILSITGQDQFRALYFGPQGVTLYYNEHVYLDRLLDTLVRKAHLAFDVLTALRRENGGDPISTVEAVLGSGVVPEDVFLSTFREEMEESVYDLFLWENVHWEFFEGVQALQGHEGVINENFFLNPDSLVMEAARRLDEWSVIRQQVVDQGEIFAPVAGAEPQGIVQQGNLQDIFEVVDGKRNVGRLIDITGLSPFHVSKALAELGNQGLIEPLRDDRLIANADECFAEARYEDAVHLLERAIQDGIGVPEAYVKVAKVYELQQELAKANWHLKCYATELVEAGRIDEAVKVLESCLHNIPTDLDAWERLVHGLVHQQSPSQDPHEVGKNLIDLYLELDETERARKVLEGLLKVRPEDIELKKTLVAVHTKAGDTKRVMELYESIADDLVASKDPIGAVRFLQKILMLDRTRTDVSDRVKQLYLADERNRARQRGMFLTVASLVCLGVLGTLYYLYDQNVASRFDELDAKPFLEDRDFEGAIRMYEDFLADNPLSWSAYRKVEPVVADLGSRRDLHLAEIERERRNRDRVATQKRKEYLALWDEYEAAFEQERDAEKALARLKRILTLVQEAGQQQDEIFKQRNDLDLAERTLRDHLANAGRIEVRIRQARKKGDLQTERALALEIHEDYPYTPPARRVEIPILFRTEPPGAEVLLDDKPLVADGQPVRTPAVIRVPKGGHSALRLRLPGYEERAVAFDSETASPQDLVLRVQALRELVLPDDALTGLVTEGDRGIVGLRSGRVLCVDLDTAAVVFELKLPGLEEIRHPPVVRGGLAVLATTEGWLRAYALRDGAERWQRRLTRGKTSPILETTVGLVVQDSGGSLRCFDPQDGREIWTQTTGLDAGNRLRFSAGRIWAADGAGRILAIEPGTGEIWRSWKLDTGIQDGPVVHGGTIAVWCQDGSLRGIDNLGKQVWKLDIGQDFTKGAVLVDSHGFVFASTDGVVKRVSPADGEVRFEKHLPGPFAGGACQTGANMFFTSQKGDATYLTSFVGDGLDIRWEYRLPKGIRGHP
ncbi:MAG: PQQ-binding-like beta-propeller repeat protein, partial [Planctomycetota bacterium]